MVVNRVGSALKVTSRSKWYFAGFLCANCGSWNIADETRKQSMSEMIELSLVRCDGSSDGPSEMVRIRIERSVIESKLVSRSEEVLEPGRSRGLHLAADNEIHGAVTYLQHITEGSFYVYVGKPEQLEEHVSYLATGSASMTTAAWYMRQKSVQLVARECFICSGAS